MPHDDRIERLGRRPFPLPMGVRLNEDEDPDGPFLLRELYKAMGHEATAVVVQTEEGTERVEGDVIVSSCGAINSAALLLRSATDEPPNGLANRSDQVGRNYMAHNNAAMLALSKEKNPTRFQRTLGLNDFYFSGDKVDYPLGHIQMLGKSNTTQLSTEAPRFTPNMALGTMAEHALDFWLTTEDLPDGH